MIIKRTIFDAVKNHLSSQEITLITGPRQAGKTTLMEILEEDLKKEGEKTVFLRLDIDKDRPFFDSQEKLLARVALEIGESRGYIFIDEIQRKENAGLFLKGLYDMRLPYKFIVSGSGSIELKEKIHESLPGRKRLFELSTLSFEEFVNFKTEYKYVKTGESLTGLASFFDVFLKKAQDYLEQYLNFGGYPRVVLAETTEEKRAAIDDIYQSFLERDMIVLLDVQKTDALTNLVRVLAAQIGNLVNVAELSNTLGLSVETVKKYMWYLEKTYIVERVSPFFKNVRKEITKAPIFYFVDLGLRNYAANQFGNAIFTPAGFLFENFVYNLLKNHLGLTATTIHFWRTKDKAEVDFVLNTGLKAIPIEVKYSHLKSPEISRSFRSFLEKYQPERAYIVHTGSHFESQLEGTKVYFIPFFNIQAIIRKELS